MFPFETWLFPQRFIPHGHCYLWQPDLLRLHLVADAMTAIAYYSIPVMLIYFVRQRKDVPFRKIFWLFSAFIVTCGTTHVLSIWTLWYPAYWLEGCIKALTAFVSVYTALELLPILPQALSLPSPEKLQEINDALAQEIEDRKEAEQALQSLNQELEERVEARSMELLKSQQRWQSLLENLNLIVMGINGNGTVAYVNPYFSSVTGYAPEEIIGQNWFDSLFPRQSGKQMRRLFENQPLADRETIPQELEHQEFERQEQESREQQIIQSQTAKSTGDNPILRKQFQAPILTSTGGERIISWNNSILPEESPSTFNILGIGEDITERFALQRMKDEFISVVSHELRTPLTSIYGALDLFHSGLLEMGSERSKKVLDVAVQNCEHLVQLVSDILEIDRLESGKIKLVQARMNTRSITQSAVRLMSVLADQKDIDLHVSDPGLTAWGDQERIVQVLTNLIDNAIKFSKTGSRVQLLVEPWDESLPQNVVCFQVIDSGCGIPQDHLSTVFDRFSQVNPSNARHRGGTGLGLAICRSIVNQHQGRIWVESVVNQGCHFYFTLPVSSVPASDDDVNR